MRAMWKGAVAFGLVSVPIKLYSATGNHDITLHQVHRDDGGRIRYRKTCSVCGEEVGTGDIVKGYTTESGELVVLTGEDLADLPVSSDHEISVLEFVPAEQVDPIMLDRTYYLEPEAKAVKPYVLLREALAATERMAVVKVSLRQRESMAVLRVRDDVICLQTLMWPDEIRTPEFPILDADVELRPQELQMASSLVESLAADFDPSAFEDSYQAALLALVEAKRAGGETAPARVERAGEDQGGDVIDLLAALRSSVEDARGRRPRAAEADASDEVGTTEQAPDAAPARSTPARQPAARKPAPSKAAAKKPAPSKAAAKKTAAKRPAASKQSTSKNAARAKPDDAGTGTTRSTTGRATAKKAVAKRTSAARAS